MKAARQAVEYAAMQLGFSGMGVAPANADQGNFLRHWVETGCHADMSWMERHLSARENPQLLLPGVKSIIMLTYEYPRSDARRESGTMARYAQGEDYHKIISAKLADLDETLSFYGGEQRCFTDSGPVSERFFAARAGLGWIGRNGLLVRLQGGSYCFLAGILTTLDLPTDEPIANHCGKCRRCEEACPTGALRDGSCDARLCLAYWTIEAGEGARMPEKVKEALGERMYGCDACQEACPWNSRESKGRVDARLLMPAKVARVQAKDLAVMGDEEWQNYFAHSPVRRTGAVHLRKNIEAMHSST